MRSFSAVRTMCCCEGIKTTSDLPILKVFTMGVFYVISASDTINCIVITKYMSLTYIQ